MEPTVLEPPVVQPKQEPTDESIPGSSGSVENKTISLISIKKEKFDDDDDTSSTILKIKKEKLEDDTDKTLETGREALAMLSLDPTAFAGTYRSTPPDGTIVYFQFPDELPVLEGSVRESVDQQQDPDKNPADLVQNIGDLPEGFVGRLQILSSGRTRFVIGENNFDVDSGRPVGFRQVILEFLIFAKFYILAILYECVLFYMQELLSVDVEKKTLTNLGTINKKFVLTPDIECLITDSL